LDTRHLHQRPVSPRRSSRSFAFFRALGIDEGSRNGWTVLGRRRMVMGEGLRGLRMRFEGNKRGGRCLKDIPNGVNWLRPYQFDAARSTLSEHSSEVGPPDRKVWAVDTRGLVIHDRLCQTDLVRLSPMARRCGVPTSAVWPTACVGTAASESGLPGQLSQARESSRRQWLLDRRLHSVSSLIATWRKLWRFRRVID
jgi:hypothetical protein